MCLISTKEQVCIVSSVQIPEGLPVLSMMYLARGSGAGFSFSSGLDDAGFEAISGMSGSGSTSIDENQGC